MELMAAVMMVAVMVVAARREVVMAAAVMGPTAGTCSVVPQSVQSVPYSHCSLHWYCACSESGPPSWQAPLLEWAHVSEQSMEVVEEVVVVEAVVVEAVVVKVAVVGVEKVAAA